MAIVIVENAELWFAKLNPKRPNNKYNKENPTWEVQIRTSSKEAHAHWKNLKLRTKTIVDDDTGEIYFQCNLRKKSLKDITTKEPNAPVKVMDGKGNPVDPDTIGNGSIGNIRLFQYEYGEDKKIANMLMAIQLVKHIVYTPSNTGGFKPIETEVVMADDSPSPTPSRGTKVEEVPFEDDDVY